MRHYFLLLLLMLLLTGCGHNVLTNYEVEGLDLSVPIFGYPFGIRVGSVKVNSNLIRGNASFASQSNTGTEIGSGTIQKTNIIQFSSNTQINEGNVEKILTSADVPPEVKKQFVDEYLTAQNAPPLLQASTNTPTSITATADDPKMHKSKLKRTPSIIDKISSNDLVGKIIKAILSFFILTTLRTDRHRHNRGHSNSCDHQMDLAACEEDPPAAVEEV